MAATLTASVNPVDVWGAGATGTTTITWNTGSNVPARLYLQTGFTIAPPPAILFDGDPAKGSLAGAKVMTVELGPTYTLILRQVTDNAVLATLRVTTFDALQAEVDRAAGFAAWANRFDPPQAIFALSIQAGVDSARIQFRTVQPTVPIVAATAPDGSNAASAFPVLAGMRIDHDVTLGYTRPLAQQTAFKLTITAAGHGYAGKSFNAVATSHFTTGSRSAKVVFEMIQILNGAGEFTFQFGAGDADLLTDLGEPWPSYRNDFGDSDPPHWVRYTIDIANAPRRLWVGTTGAQYAHPLDGSLRKIGTKPDFEGPLTGYAHDDATSVAWANAAYDIAGGGAPVVNLTTGFFDIMYEVRGQVFANVQQGTAPKPASTPSLSGRNTGQAAAAALAGAAAQASVLPKQGKAMIVSRGADGAVYRRIAERGRARDEGWIAVTPPAAGPVAAIATAADRLACFALDREGAVLRADAHGTHAARAWQALGGRFTGAVTATLTEKTIELLAQDHAGGLFHRSVAIEAGPPISDWRRIGEAKPGQFAAIPLHEHGLAIFALDPKGVVQHHAHRRGEWRSEGWHAIPGAAGVLLGASSTAGKGLALALIDAAMQLHTLTWRGYPEGHPESWRAEGDLQAWLVRPRDEIAEAQTAIAAVA